MLDVHDPFDRRGGLSDGCTLHAVCATGLLRRLLESSPLLFLPLKRRP